MLKNLLRKCCSMIGREDLADEIKNANSVEDILKNNIKNDIYKLISYLNYTISNIFEFYLSINYTEKITSNSEKQIEFFTFSYKPIKIIRVENSDYATCKFIVKPNFLIVEEPDKEYYITYRIVPPPVHDLTDSIMLPKNFNEKIVCLGVVSEYLASAGKYDESEYFLDKFKFELFKVKTRRERRLKSTFCL